MVQLLGFFEEVFLQENQANRLGLSSPPQEPRLAASPCLVIHIQRQNIKIILYSTQAAGLTHMDTPVTSGGAWMGCRNTNNPSVLYDNQQKLAA